MDGPRFRSVESTGAVTANNSWQIIPGTSISGTWQAGDIVVINYSGVFVHQSGSYAYVDVAPFVNATMIAVGGYTRGDIYFTYSPAYMPYASIAVYVIPTTGAYTFDLRTIRTGGTANVLVGGNSSQVSECIFTLTTIKP